jgi:hypothetical protein
MSLLYGEGDVRPEFSPVGVTCSPSRSAFAYILSIKRPVSFLDPAAPHFESMRQRSIGRGKFFGYHQHTFQFFEARQVLV